MAGRIMSGGRFGPDIFTRECSLAHHPDLFLQPQKAVHQCFGVRRATRNVDVDGDEGNSDGPIIYGCCSGPMMIRMGAQLADGIQLSDFTPDMMPEAMENVRAGLARRELPAENFRIGNFWAWHIKQDRDVSLYEARRELIWRGAIAAKYEHEIAPFTSGEDEVKLVIDNWDNFFKAYWTRSGQIDGVPEDLVNRLIAGMSSAGDLGDIDREVERYRRFKDSGLTELSLRLFDDPMDGLKMIGERVLPALR